MDRKDVIAYLNEEIENLMKTRDFLQGSSDGAQASRPAGGMSAAAKQSRSEMMKARWAAKRAQESGDGHKGPARKRYFSPEARKKMADAQKRRWAAFRKNKGK